MGVSLYSTDFHFHINVLCLTFCVNYEKVSNCSSRGTHLKNLTHLLLGTHEAYISYEFMFVDWKHGAPECSLT